VIGNDIVDLEYCDSPPYKHVRYLERVCTAPELEMFRQATDRLRTLAILWAAKEATFKCISGRLQRPHFAPREFTVTSGEPLDRSKHLFVCHTAGQFRVEVHSSDRWVHTVATLPGVAGWSWQTRELLDAGAETILPTHESAAARTLAGELLSENGFPPADFLANRESIIGAPFVSLSHHGRFVAAAVAWPFDRTSQPMLSRDCRDISQGDQCSTCMA